jgi:hypothetical protein
MMKAGKMKFKEDRPFATPEAAEQKVINSQLREAGGSYEEYSAAVRAAIAHGWLTMHPSGGYLMFTQAGADLFA